MSYIRKCRRHGAVAFRPVRPWSDRPIRNRLRGGRRYLFQDLPSLCLYLPGRFVIRNRSCRSLRPSSYRFHQNRHIPNCSFSPIKHGLQRRRLPICGAFRGLLPSRSTALLPLLWSGPFLPVLLTPVCNVCQTIHRNHRSGGHLSFRMIRE